MTELRNENDIVNPNNSAFNDKNEKNDNKIKHFNSPFGIDDIQIENMFEKYDHRNYNEEIIFLEEYGGIPSFENSLKTNKEYGISLIEDEINNRINFFGTNVIAQEPLPHFCAYVLETLGDLMLRILIFAGLLQIILGAIPGVAHNPDKDWIDGIGIIVAVFIVVFVSSFTNYSKEKKFKDLNDKNSSMVKIFIKREGKIEEKSPDDVLVGDLVKISTGSIVPADGIIVSCEGQIKIEESSLTGESDLIEKDVLEECVFRYKNYSDKSKNKHSIPSPFIFSGTLVKEGGGWFIALAVGTKSKKGKIQESVQQNQENEDAKTPLENKLDKIATQIGYFGMAAGLFTLIALFIRFGITYAGLVSNYDDFQKNPIQGRTVEDPKKTVSKTIIGIFLLCITIIVVAIPEGLPLAVTLSLAFSIKKMMNDNNLVRKMYACETMGGANYICSDKTGTLTKNEMNIFNVYNGKETIDLREIAMSKDDPSNIYKPYNFFSQDYFELLIQGIICNVQMIIDENQNISNESKTDLPFAKILKKFGVNLFEQQTKYKVNTQDIKRIAFSSARKKMTTLVSHPSFPTGYRVFTKGASEIVLKSVSYYLNPSNNEKNNKNDEDNEKFKEIINEYANKTLRTICLAFKDVSEKEAHDFFVKEEEDSIFCAIEKTGFTMIGIVGIKDTLRDGVIEAIKNCHSAGITVVMVTGDLKETAIAISKECGIWNLPDHAEVPEYYSLTGEEFFISIGGIECSVCNKDIKDCKDPKTKTKAKELGISEENIQNHRIKNMKMFEKITKNLRVLARSRPLDKYALVLGLRSLGHVVAVTGDGTNDAQALSKSDVGFAMGIEGTDIAKDAADIIILDDNFASIVKAVVWGRNIFDCIRKFIQFQLTVNITACTLVFVTACVGSETPISAIQMLWLNMIMDSLGSLALATEPPHQDILNRKPNSRNDHMISERMWKHIIASSSLLFSILLGLYLKGEEFIPEEDSIRIKEYEIIGKCFGTYPGIPPVNGKYTIMSGSAVNWSSKHLLTPGLTAVECGDYAKSQDMSFAFVSYKSAYGNTVHMTMLFNIFVIFTLFNQINSRVLLDELNIFLNIQNNLFFIVIIIIEMGLQIILIQFGSSAFSVSDRGITGTQWGICIGFSASAFVMSFIMKFIPLEILIKKILNIRKSNKVSNVEEEDNYRSEDKLNSSSKKLPISKEHSKKKNIVDTLRKSQNLERKQSSKLRRIKDD